MMNPSKASKETRKAKEKLSQQIRNTDPIHEISGEEELSIEPIADPIAIVLDSNTGSP